jgi:hypothetical protein
MSHYETQWPYDKHAPNGCYEDHKFSLVRVPNTFLEALHCQVRVPADIEIAWYVLSSSMHDVYFEVHIANAYIFVPLACFANATKLLISALHSFSDSISHL